MAVLDRGLLLAVLGASAITMAPLARADGGSPLARARTALDALEYEKASRLLDEALRGGGNQPQQVVEIYRLHGEVLAAMGRTADAELKFERLLVLDPKARLADGTSPKISEPFQAAQASTESLQALSVRCSVDRASPTTVAVVAESDPLAMVAGVQVAYETRNGRRGMAEPARDAAGLVVLEHHATPLTVVVVDEHGNQLRRIDVAACEDVTRTAERATPTPIRPPRDRPPARPVYAHWGLWAGIAVGVAGFGTYFGLEARSDSREIDRMNADSTSYEYAEAQKIEQSAERNALLANVSFAVAGTTAIVALVMFLRHRSAPASRATVLAPTAHRDGAGLVLSMPF